MKALIIIMAIAFGLLSCTPNSEIPEIKSSGNFSLNDTIDIFLGETYTNAENNLSIKLDSVLNDSRCPIGVECIWAGNAKVRFELNLNDDVTTFSLNTHPDFTNDTIIGGFGISMIGLEPYPVYPNEIVQKDYHAQMVITK